MIMIYSVLMLTNGPLPFALRCTSSYPSPGWNVDCEYNRDGVEPKRLRHLELYPDSEDVEAKTVFPDVIVHRRGTQQNHLVLEFKKSTSRVDRRIDLLKLQGYKQQLGYDHALFVEVGTEGQSIITALEWV